MLFASCSYLYSYSAASFADAYSTGIYALYYFRPFDATVTFDFCFNKCIIRPLDFANCGYAFNSVAQSCVSSMASASYA